jgi:hypothetical protein
MRRLRGGGPAHRRPAWASWPWPPGSPAVRTTRRGWCTVLDRDRVPPLPLRALRRDLDRRAARRCAPAALRPRGDRAGAHAVGDRPRAGRDRAAAGLCLADHRRGDDPVADPGALGRRWLGSLAKLSPPATGSSGSRRAVAGCSRVQVPGEACRAWTTNGFIGLCVRCPAGSRTSVRYPDKAARQRCGIVTPNLGRLLAVPSGMTIFKFTHPPCPITAHSRNHRSSSSIDALFRSRPRPRSIAGSRPERRLPLAFDHGEV